GTAVSSGVFTIISSDFSVQVNPASQTLLRGMSTSFTVSLQAVGNFSGQAALTATVTPSSSALTTSFSQSTITAGGSSTLTVNANATADAGTFNILVTATSGQLVRTRTVTVNVVSPDFSLVFNPAQLTAARGQKGKLTAMINRTGGFTGNVTVT